MPRASRNHDHESGETGREFAVSPHQLGAVRDPRASIHAVMAAETERYIGRPYLVWREDPELARSLNDQLSEKDN